MQQNGRRSLKVAGVVLICTAVLFVGLAQAQPFPGGKPMRPAATGPTPEEQSLKKLPVPAKTEELEAQAMIPAEQHCMRNPKCRQKLEMIKQGKRPAVTLPTATEPPPEEKLQKSLPAPAQGPHGSVFGPVERFFSWVNPFVPDSAWAQGTISSSTLSPSTTLILPPPSSTVGTTLYTFTPNSRYSSSPYGYIGLYGGYISANSNYYVLHNTYSTPSTYTDNKPYILIYANLATAGNYMIDVMASPSYMNLRHQYNGPILETWDLTKGCGASVCHYQATDYYAAGSQYWYLWVVPKWWGSYFYSVTIKKY